MMYTQRKNNISWTTLTLTLLNIVLLSIVLVPSTHAVSFDQHTDHKCPRYLSTEDPFHSNNGYGGNPKLTVFAHVHAVSSDQHTDRNCPHCTSTKDPSHGDNSYCDYFDGLIALKSRNFNTELDDSPEFTAFPPANSIYTKETYYSEIQGTTTKPHYFLPIYLQNCAFLN